MSKRYRFLNAQLAIWIADRNYNRPRFNRDAATPAQLAGCLDRRLAKTQLLSWRHDWGRPRSSHPLSSGSTTVALWPCHAAKTPASH